MASPAPTSPEPSSPSPHLQTPPLVRAASFGVSPHRHHHRTVSATRTVKETRNARSEHINSEDDGASQRRINQYLIQQEIGRGSFGFVHLATDQFGQEYAVKEFSKSRLRRRAKSNLLRQARQRKATSSPSPREGKSNNSFLSDEDNSAFDLIKEEIAIMKKLNHQNLVSLIEVLDDPEEDSLFMVLEMCKKGVVMKIDIEDAVQPYDEENCRFWFRDLVLGIEYLHAQGVIHRDIKPDNCLLTEDDTLKLVDFGVSEMFEKSSDMKIAKSAGSPAFMAPELCQVSNKDGVYGKPADIWSMGITLHCLMFGHVPFQKSNMLELYDSIVQDPLTIPETCSPEARDLLMRMLDKSPETRIKMPDLREHPWVTADGSDMLLPASENCASDIEPITEEDKNAAITGNMKGLMVVLRAANKFKGLLERRHPGSFESILGRASKMVAPPLTMQDVYNKGSHLKGAFKHHISRALSGHHEPPEEVKEGQQEEEVRGEQGKEKEKEAEALSAKLSRATIEEDKASSPSSHASPVAAPCDEPRRHTYSEAQGHARDPLSEQYYLRIGTGTGPTTSLHSVASLPEDQMIVSESPPATTETSFFEEAYQASVADIRNSGRASTVYGTRRVDGARGRLGRLMERAGGNVEHAGGGMRSAGLALQEKARKSKAAEAEKKSEAER